MPGQVIDSAPGAAAPVAAPTSQDIETIRQQQDAAWDDDTDVGAGEVKNDGATGDAEPTDPDVIVDKPALAGGVLPAPKPGAAAPAPAAVVKPEGDDGKPVTAEKKDEGASATGDTPVVKTAEQKSQEYWVKVSEAHPTAYADSNTPQFMAWFNSLSPADRAAASNMEKPEESVKLMGRYYADLRSGKVSEPAAPAAPTAMDVAEFLKTNNLSGRKIKLANGTETTLGDMAKPEEFGDLLSAMGAISAATEEVVLNKATQLIENLITRGVLVTGDMFAQLKERLGDKDLAEKVPDASAIAADPKFQPFISKSKLLQNAWASGDPEQRAEVINMFKAEKAKDTVAAVTVTQKKVNTAKNAVHSGTLHGGAPNASKAGDEGKTTGELQDQAWDTPIDVEGQKV